MLFVSLVHNGLKLIFHPNQTTSIFWEKILIHPGFNFLFLYLLGIVEISPTNDKAGTKCLFDNLLCRYPILIYSVGFAYPAIYHLKFSLAHGSSGHQALDIIGLAVYLVIDMLIFCVYATWGVYITFMILGFVMTFNRLAEYNTDKIW